MAAVAVLLLPQSVPAVPVAQAAVQVANLVLTTMVMFKAAVAAAAVAAGQTVAAAAAALNVPTQKPKMTTNRTAVPVEPAVLQVRPVMPVRPVTVPAPTNMESITTDMMPNLEPAVPVDTE